MLLGKGNCGMVQIRSVYKQGLVQWGLISGGGSAKIQIHILLRLLPLRRVGEKLARGFLSFNCAFEMSVNQKTPNKQTKKSSPPDTNKSESGSKSCSRPWLFQFCKLLRLSHKVFFLKLQLLELGDEVRISAFVFLNKYVSSPPSVREKLGNGT